jgi:hypothetical protein
VPTDARLTNLRLPDPAERAALELPATELELLLTGVARSGLNPRLHTWATVEVLAELKVHDPARKRAVQAKAPPPWLRAVDAAVARERVLEVAITIRAHRASIRAANSGPRRHAGAWNPDA